MKTKLLVLALLLSFNSFSQPIVGDLFFLMNNGEYMKAVPSSTNLELRKNQTSRKFYSAPLNIDNLAKSVRNWDGKTVTTNVVECYCPICCDVDRDALTNTLTTHEMYVPQSWCPSDCPGPVDAEILLSSGLTVYYHGMLSTLYSGNGLDSNRKRIKLNQISVTTVTCYYW
jgi:hypothetical protein